MIPAEAPIGATDGENASSYISEALVARDDEILRIQQHYEIVKAENAGLRAELELERAQESRSRGVSPSPPPLPGKKEDMDVPDFLRMYGLQSLSEIFHEEELYKVSELCHLSEEDPSSVLKLKLGPRNKLRLALKDLDEKHTS